MRRVHFLVTLLQTTGLVLAIGALCWLLVAYVCNVCLLRVQTASMQPTFRSGDAVLMQKSSRAKLQPGMIVSYRSSRDPNILITHRVVQVSANMFQTKGDALASPDPAVRSSLLVGRVVAVVPSAGKLLGWFSSWPGLVMTVYFPAGLLILRETMQLGQHYKYRAKYRLYKAQVV